MKELLGAIQKDLLLRTAAREMRNAIACEFPGGFSPRIRAAVRELERCSGLTDAALWHAPDLDNLAEAIVARLTASPAPEQHNDDIAVDRFAAAMKEKLAEKRKQGRGGWDDKDQCSAERLSELLRRHVGKGDPVDVGNFAMMLHQRGESIYPAPERAEPPQGGEVVEVLKEMRTRKINHGKNTSPTLEAWADRIEAALLSMAQEEAER